jgi:hypothetical protein
MGGEASPKRDAEMPSPEAWSIEPWVGVDERRLPIRHHDEIGQAPRIDLAQ